MNVLIIESQEDLGHLWQRHLERQGMSVTRVRNQDDAVSMMTKITPDVIILNLLIEEGSALAISDFASFRCPDARIIFVTSTSFFSDGSIFAHAGNACAFVPTQTPPEDLAAMVEHYAAAS